MTFLRLRLLLILLRREDVGDDEADGADDEADGGRGDAGISGSEDEHAGAQSGNGNVAERVLDERMPVALLSVGLSLSRALGACGARSTRI